MRAEPAPATTKGPALPELSRERRRVRCARADGRKGRTAVNSSWERGVRDGRERPRGHRGRRRRSSGHTAAAPCGPEEAHGRASHPPAAYEHCAEQISPRSHGGSRGGRGLKEPQPEDTPAGAARAGAAARGGVGGPGEMHPWGAVPEGLSSRYGALLGRCWESCGL